VDAVAVANVHSSWDDGHARRRTGWWETLLFGGADHVSGDVEMLRSIEPGLRAAAESTDRALRRLRSDPASTLDVRVLIL
jgi:hypothetical protein